MSTQSEPEVWEWLELYDEDRSKSWHIRRLAAKGWNRPTIRAWFANRGVPLARSAIRDALRGTDYPAAHGMTGKPPVLPRCPECGQPIKPR